MLVTQHQKLKEKTIGARKRPHKNTKKQKPLTTLKQTQTK